MTYYNPKIPEKNGELLCIPSLNLIPHMVKSNKEKFKKYNFTIGYEGFNEFRKRLREKVILLSEKFTANLGIKSHLYNNSDTIVQTGHQPVFYHPGIIIKNLILNKIGMMEGINAINLIVDTDNFKEIAVNIPSYRDGIKIEKEILLSNQYPIPYEFSTPPSQEAFDLFIESIKNHLSHPEFKNLHAHFNRYINKIGDTQKNFKTLSEFMTAIRRIYEEEIESQYLEIPVSHICDTDEFLLFFLSIAMESEKFTSIYNCHLGRYRKDHKLRYPVNPFPNLKINGEKIELPFWHFFPQGGARGRIFAECADDKINIFFEDREGIEFKRNELDKGIELIKKHGIKIRTKAITLTLFNRMFVSDIFIHGVGGAKYDRITDEIIRDFYKVEPPEFITTSLTLYPTIDSPKEYQEEKIKDMEKKLRDMKYNPERYIEDTQEEMKTVIKEKEYIISLLKEDNVDKREFSRRLKKLNEKIYQSIKSAAENIEEDINVLKKLKEESEATQRRDYPYFLFSPEEIMKILPFHHPS